MLGKFQNLIIFLSLNLVQTTDFQNDYCSYTHSQHVLDRFQSEVVPIFDTYDISMVKDAVQCPLGTDADRVIKSQLKQFGSKSYGSSKASHECPICGKKFQSENYLEFHMKLEHHIDEKLQTRYHRSGNICPAELCDIFECSEISEQKLRFQTYTLRNGGNGNYEDQPMKSRSSKDRRQEPPFRWQMIQEYDEARRATLLQKCHRLFLDCVDYEAAPSVSNVMKGFDFFSQIYCNKFEEGQMEKGIETHNYQNHFGSFKMVKDIKDNDYKTPLSQLSDKKLGRKKDDDEVQHVLWWVGFVVSSAMMFLYGVGIYFTYFDDTEEFAKTFRNETIPGYTKKPKIKKAD